MRAFLALTIVLCLVGGLYLLQGPDFYWPARGDPSQAIFISGLASQLLGAALLIVALLGWMTVRHAGNGHHRAASSAWQVCFFLLLVLALGLMGAAVLLGEVGPNPESRTYGTEGTR